MNDLVIWDSIINQANNLATFLLSIYAVYKIISGYMDKRKQKLEIVISRKEWIDYATRSSLPVEVEPDIRLDTHIVINNKLGKNTSLIDIRLERENGDTIILTNATTIPKDQTYSFHHIWELRDTSVKGKLIVNHTHGEAFIPIDEKVSVPIEKIPKRGMQIETGKRPR